MKKIILLVEDNPYDAELILQALGDYAVSNEVVVAGDGAMALDYLYRRGEFEGRPGGRPAVVVLDLKMPKVSGLEVLKAVKSDPEKKRIPVVVFTSSREEKDLAESFDLGANAYVVKPLDFKEFVSALKGIAFFWTVLNTLPTGRR